MLEGYAHGAVDYMTVPIIPELLRAKVRAFAGLYRKTRALERLYAAQAQDVRAHLAAIVDSSEDAIISKTMEGIIQSWNQAAERLYGYTAAEVIGQPITLLIPPDLADDFPRIMARLTRGERIEHYETQRVTKDGTRLDIALTISPIRDEHGADYRRLRDCPRYHRAETAGGGRTERLRDAGTARGQNAPPPCGRPWRSGSAWKGKSSAPSTLPSLAASPRGCPMKSATR